jgi:uncharacterized protein YoxC
VTLTHDLLLAIQRSLQILNQKVDVIMSQSDEVLQDVADIETGVAKINTGVQSALALITDLEAQVAAGQPVTPEALAALKQAVTDVGTAADATAAIAPPAA